MRRFFGGANKSASEGSNNGTADDSTAGVSSFRDFSAGGDGDSSVQSQPTSNSAGVGAAVGAARVVTAPPTSSWSSFRRNASAEPIDHAKMERAVVAASRSFGEGVQGIVLSAKAKHGSKNAGEWKQALLRLLGQRPPRGAPGAASSPDRGQAPATGGLFKGIGSSPSPNPTADIDILIQNAACDNFVLKCVENELAPNLIHCLRLLRVLELQHANAHLLRQRKLSSDSMSVGSSDDNISTDGGSVDGTGSVDAASSLTNEVRPVSKLATAKVTKLLCLLCTDTSVGEQLRPHLFGLLALSGASYPPTGVHVAMAASEVICQFAKGCLNRNLVWFIHDRKMMIHMTDDVKELSGMMGSSGENQAAAVPLGLSGADAEKAGLIVVALRTIVMVVYESIRFDTIDLVKDFESAGGFDVIQYSILHATGDNGKPLLDLLPLLACCPKEILIDSEKDPSVLKLASNVRIFDMMADLLTRSNPLLRRKRLLALKSAAETEGGGEVLFLDLARALAKPGDLHEQAMDSLRVAVRTRLEESKESDDVEDDLDVAYDLSSALLAITLQLFADHPNNFEKVEGRLHILTHSLLAFPCYASDEVKSFALKTLELVLTAVGPGRENAPVNACIEIFFALCETLVKNSLNFLIASDEQVEPITAEQETEVLRLMAADADLMGSTLEKLLEFDQKVSSMMMESGVLIDKLDSILELISRVSRDHTKKQDSLPSDKTPLDKTFCLVCRVLTLLVSHQPEHFAEEHTMKLPDSAENTSLHKLLRIAQNQLGVEAVVQASSVFEAYLSSFSSSSGSLRNDMEFTLRTLVDLSRLAKESDYNQGLVKRAAAMLSMLRSVLESKSVSRIAFQQCEGFEALMKVLLNMKDIASPCEKSQELLETCMDLLHAIMGLLDAAIGMKSKNPLTANEISPLAIQADVSVDYVSSQLSLQSASSLNRNYLRQKGFYLNFAAALAATGLLASESAKKLLDLALCHMEPELRSANSVDDVQNVRNPDAIRLALGIAVFVPDVTMSTRILDRMLRLCEQDRLSSTLPQLAACGLCFSLTNPKEFGPILLQKDHVLKSRFQMLLSRVAACSMSYMDFVGILRNIAGPVLVSDGSDGRVKLPVISSSIKKRATVGLAPTEVWSDEFEEREREFSSRLECVCEIAQTADQFARILVGGDSVNTIAVLMHQVRLDERLRATAEEGRLRYLEVECVDASELQADKPQEKTGNPTDANKERLWAPLAGSGFTFSLWLRHDTPIGSSAGGNMHILDINSVTNVAASATSQGSSFFSVWYDLPNQRFNVMSSASYRGEPTCFPVSPMLPNVWHHVLVTYTPAKRSVIARKSVFSIFVDGRPLEAEVRVDSVNLPPNCRVVIGAPNPALAMSGVVRGVLPVWALGPTLLLSTVLLDLDATALYSYGPGFPGLLWGDRPQRLSLSATGTALFSMLAKVGETGSIASALRRRDVPKLEAAGYTSMGHTARDDLSAVSLLCHIPPECVIFGYQASTVCSKMRNEALKKERRLGNERLVNLARLNFGHDAVATDAIAYGKGTVVAPLSFKDCLRWIGGPSILFPLVNAASSSRVLALSLQMIRLGSQSHRPNLEMLQAGGGYRMLSVILQAKGVVDEKSLDQCLAFAIHGFEPDPTAEIPEEDSFGGRGSSYITHSHGSDEWVFADLDAMKHLLLNHQVWDLRKFGPRIPLRLLSVLNRLVDHRAVHKAFNARRLHQVGIVRWALHLAIESSELYTASDAHRRKHQDDESQLSAEDRWFCECPDVAEVAVGGDPGNPFLLECKNLLRRVLTFMLTPGDLEALVESIVFTVSIGGRSMSVDAEAQFVQEERMLPGPTLRLHLVRLLEELIVDGVNEIVANAKEAGGQREDVVMPHAGGVASPNQPYFTTSTAHGKATEGELHPKHQQAQNFLSAFASFLTPVWFATVLEGCHEEASATALLRLMILMLQGSSAFEKVFKNGGAFSPFVLSIPRYSTSPGIAMVMLSHLLNVPILHLHALPTLDPEQLCEVFDSEGEDPEFNVEEMPSDPSSGIFALLVECMGRNVQLVTSKNEAASKAAGTNQAIVKLLAHRHETSPSFREYCRTLSFLEPLSQALCLVYDERLHAGRSFMRSKRTSLLADVPKDLTPTERFVGSTDDPDSTGMGIVRLVRMIITDSVFAGPRAAPTISAIFRSFPIHASPQQVEAFHLVLIEHCCSVIDGMLQRGEAEPLALSNCIGICSVFLDHEVGAFFTSEAVLRTVSSTVSILNTLLRFDTPAIYSLSLSEHSMLTSDVAYLANLACATALRSALPYNAHDRGDEDLQAAMLAFMDMNIESLLLLPSRDRKSNWKVPSGKVSKPSPNSKVFEIWQSASITRCPLSRRVFFPDSFAVSSPDVISVAPLLVSLHELLLSPRDDVRGLTVNIFVALLQHRAGLLSELLVAEVKRQGRTDTIDVVNRGGFKALMASHEAATVADGKKSTASFKKRYASFFDWFEKNHEDVRLVFDSIEKTAFEVFPGLKHTSTPQIEAVESEQKLMLMRLSSQSADRTMLGRLERAELARLCTESTAEIHSQWKRQGFDDLAYGAMKWKTLLRQMKGSSSIWEGGLRLDKLPSLTPEDRLASVISSDSGLDAQRTVELVKRWKLDLTEGHERQRRRLLPNYEFHGLYNLDEEQDVAAVSDTPDSLNARAKEESAAEAKAAAEFLIGGGQMEATAALLKDLNIKRSQKVEDDDGLDENEIYMEESSTEATTLSATSDIASMGEDEGKGTELSGVVPAGDAAAEKTEEEEIEEKDSSSYELITGLLQAGDWPDKSYNVRRCTGLEVTKALLLWCGNSIYVIDGFEQTGGDGMEGKITRVERERSSFHINLRPKDFKVSEESDNYEVSSTNEDRSNSGAAGAKNGQTANGPNLNEESTDQIIYEHRSQRILLTDLYSVYRRRYQLQQNALEFYDVHRNSALIAFATHEEREEVLSQVLQSDIPNSIFSSGYGTYINYTKFMRHLKAKITSQWQSGKMTNFEFLMQLNSLAGRSFNDLTQYPVFPWVIADYETEELDLDDPKTYRDLSKPMGAIGEERAQQFRERYDALASTYFGEDDPPPFHYGTHYSCAAYVLYYLMRLEPFSRLALALQGGRFDVADRLFHDVGRSWRSASSENLQDVRELIPEFYYLPDFLVNTNHFDFGETQRGKTVHDVSLPKWAKGDPKRFVRINRQALESEYVSKNLHHWIDLVFGFLQRGEEAVNALNTFVHVTYEGEVDIDAMTDPIQRQSTIAQIQNFGQTPSRLDRNPFQQRTVVKALKDQGAVDFGSLSSLAPLTPPLCVVGAPHRVQVKHVQADVCKLGLVGQSDKSVGDISYTKGQLMACAKMCALIIPSKRYYRFGGLNNGLSVHAAAVSARYRENKLITIHDDLHRAPISSAKASLNGNWLVTGSVDSTLRVWVNDGTQLHLRATLCGHDGSHIKCIDLSTECGVIVSGCGKGRVLVWDLRTLTFVRALHHPQECDGKATVSASINHKNGNIVTVVGSLLSVFDINGNLIAQHADEEIDDSNPPTCAVATDCPEWMEQGVVAVTGHKNGEVRLWCMDYDEHTLIFRGTVEGNTHTSPITALRVTGVDHRQDTLLIGDSSGRVSICKTVQLDSYKIDELAKVVQELSSEKNTR